MNGGNVQDVVADHGELEVMIVDYDNEGSGSACQREFVPIRQSEALVREATEIAWKHEDASTGANTGQSVGNTQT